MFERIALAVNLGGIAEVYLSSHLGTKGFFVPFVNLLSIMI